ncbi:hypothetical protein TWF225_007705 [Orbilia oligospora]|nr:hypothetical protein TWF751_005515 [Orbilia oligospora]KAF3179181.1 hypothetical protein TWF225_007705 [Orbilia oligospora]KAF3179183.1 hypothetical protein TWF225_007705 [Orbilia oligospora]KAF3230934.1 hypothetical protein TWF128_005084 [Orbilia oligospora]KAF3230936.1 hypothetical protein TWF128_005084 [Orbilia oligospora]
MATNGETETHSVFLSHLGSLPVVSDGVTYFKGHPVGQRSLSISQSVYDTFVKPFSPYIAKANAYAGPYVTKADQFADSGLVQLEERVPIVKEPTEKLKERIINLPVYHTAQDALAFGNEKKDYALKVYNDEYNKASNGQKSLVSVAKAGISTTFILSTQTIGWIAGYLTAKKEEVKETVKEKTASE